jgi:hypothetical protein
VPATQTVNVNRFSGINTSDAPGRIPDPELIDCQNFNLGQYGELTKRKGIKTLATVLAANAVTVIGFFQTSVYTQLIVRAGNNLYWTSDGTTYNLIGAYGNVEHGIQYVDKFYIVRRDAIMVQWDGAAASTIAGSPFGTICIVHKERLFVVNSFSTTVPNRVYYSNIADFSATGWTGQFVDVRPGDGDVVTALTLLHDTLVIFKQKSMWMLYVVPDIAGWQLRNTSDQYGCVSKYSPREIEGALYFAAPRGFYRTDGYNFAELSRPVRDLFNQQPTGTASINQLVSAWWEDTIIMVIQTFATPPTWGSLANQTWNELSTQPWDSQNATYTWLIYHTKTDQWTKWAPAAEAAISAFNMVVVTGPQTLKGVYIGSRALDGKIYKYGDAVYLDGVDSPYACIVETKDLDLDQPGYVKRGKWISVERQGMGSVIVYNVADGIQQVPSILIFANNDRTALRATGPGFFRTWRVRTIAVHDGPIVMYGFALALTLRPKTLAGK